MDASDILKKRYNVSEKQMTEAREEVKADDKPREFMHAHPDGDLERSDGVKCFHVIEKGAYLEAIEKYSALSLKYSDLVDNFSVQKQELNHKTEIVCGEENKTITVAWAYVERRAYDKLKIEHDQWKEECEATFSTMKILETENEQLSAELAEEKQLRLSRERWVEKSHAEIDRQKELLTHLEQALEKIIATSHSWVITQETGAIQMPIHDSYRAIAKQALEKVKELKG